MIPTLRPRRWVCPSCLCASPVRSLPVGGQRRRWLGYSTLAPTSKTRPVTHAKGGSKHDDDLLRGIFDSPRVWDQFDTRAAGAADTGLFRNAFLTRPEGFLSFARVSVDRARAIVDKVLAASTPDEYRSIVRDLDRLSDILCRVLDMTDFVRVTHPQHQTQQRANEAWQMVFEYMNQLNTMTGLHTQLCKAMDDPEITASWSSEEKAVAEVLKLDFVKSGVNLPQSDRDRFVALSSEISMVASNFVQDMAPDQTVIVRPSSLFVGMDPVEARLLTQRGKVHMPTMGSRPARALRTVRDASTRMLIYNATRTASAASVARLERLMNLRAELASLSGFESYAHFTLRDRMMAKTPESVTRFLGALAKTNGHRVDDEMAALLAVKKITQPDATTLEPWDRDFYAESIRRSLMVFQRPDDSLSAYFSLGSVMQGLSRLFSRLYGISFRPTETSPGETWHSDVRRLDVFSETDGHVAVLYCDLFYRPDKSPNPAHFTLRCSREILEGELAEVDAQTREAEDMPQFSSREEAANDGMAFSTQTGTVKQLPTIALICDFPQTASASNRPALLSFFQVETLFHEMGHAIHSILARTSFQNVSGTRCATDLAELPSTLMEYFSTDPGVLALFARHHETGSALPYDLVAEKLRLSKRFEASDTEHQIVLAMLDQELHSSKAKDHLFDSTAMFHEVQRTYGRMAPDPPGTRWQGFFGHLSGYGSTYYSYLFDRMLARRVWDVVFASGEKGGALNFKNGERLKDSLLKWGGSRDPWTCMAELLKDDRLADGGEEAMALVGSWGSSGRSSK
ncbi:hypothetical protein B0T24DRAFT_64694 [Lasiosphaeria ovina]|uniref:Mitochondrial intermediate peptidase n=1 Tax=Lasiosphaeria ovina TaxID=92902 RepID=A0AAE0TY68_9PEZI|nr:hypothetical protein B0T24DRAFT_64694 [Lasiosphaeria ovina]